MTILRLPQPEGLRALELHCNGPFGSRMARAGWTGFTLPLPFLTVVFYWGAAVTPLTRVHEFVHVAQVARLGLWRFLAIYFRESRKGYRHNALELEAYRLEEMAEVNGLPEWAK